MDKWVFIVNPVAGNGFGKNMIPVIRKMTDRYNIDADIAITERCGHASELSLLYSEKGYRYIIGVGGDGTMNELAAPLINNKEVVTGIIPAGTGNDFIQILGFPARFSESDWQILFSKNVAAMDVGTVNGTIFLNGMGLGFDAQVAAENYTEQGKVRKGGKRKYVWHIIKTLLFYREKMMKARNEGKIVETDCFINTVAIGRRFAGGFFLTPGAIADDGMLDVCMIKRLNLFQRFNLLLKVPSGNHIYDRKVNYYKTKEIDLEFSEEVPYHVDGELHYAKRFEIRSIPGALNVIYNTDGNHFFRR
jgi:diacylglycerol kinase (ATP)